MLLICLLSGAPRGQSRRRLFLKKGRMMRTSTMIVHNHVLNKPTMSRRLQWLGREHNDYIIRWVHSLLIMSIQLLRMIYYLIEVKCLYSGLKNTTWMDRPLSVQRMQVEDDSCCPDFDFQIHGEFCTNLDGSNPSVIHGWKDGEVYFHMQLTTHRLELYRMSYPYFSEH